MVFVHKYERILAHENVLTNIKRATARRFSGSSTTTFLPISLLCSSDDVAFT